MARADAGVYAQQRTTADSSENDSDDDMRSSSSGGGSSKKRVWDATGGVMVERSSRADVRSHEAPQRKVRKSTHIVRKEEKSRLLKEMEALQEKLRTLEEQRGPSITSLRTSTRKNKLLRESIRGQQLSLATAQCVVSGLLNADHSNPLSTGHIRLGTDWNNRRKTLVAMKANAIRSACEYMKARSRFLGPLKRHMSEERFETPRGDFICAQYDVRQFPNVKSVRYVYDTLLSYLHSIEISVSERLGDITTRDDFDSVENSVATFRFQSIEFGVPVEKQDVMFMQYFSSHELSDGGPCGVVVIDCVDEDALYPRDPHKSVRKDSSVIIVMRPHWRATGDGKGGSELIVSMSMGRYIKLHQSECPLATPEAVEKLRENIMGWGDVMITSLRDSLYRHPQ